MMNLKGGVPETLVFNKRDEALKLKPKSVYSGDYQDRMLQIVAYIRVSTDKKEQLTSLKTQLEHYQNIVAQHPNWTLVKIYADEGISGTSLKHRTQFKQMIADARAGKFDMIITKSVSRYARNLIDGIKTARELLHLKKPVGILFETESLNTFRPDSEFILSVLLLVAQGESEKKSAAFRSAFQWRCDAQRYNTPVNALLGYTKDENGTLRIEPEGARTVKAIYAMFLNGFPVSRIARVLTASGKITGKNNTVWGASSVMGIIRNERYCGDVVAQKTVTTDVLEHKTERNRGQSALHYRDGHHEGIVARAEHVRALLLVDANPSSAYYNPYYEIQVVRSGLLAGFIPLNMAFGGYHAKHYLGAVTTPEFMRLARNEQLRESGIRVIRVQDTDHRGAAQLTISDTSLVVSRECVQYFPQGSTIEMLLHPRERLLAVRGTAQDNPNGIRWPAHQISAAAFMPILYELMGWNTLWKHRVLANPFKRNGEAVLLFDLNDPEYIMYEEIQEGGDHKRRRRVGNPMQAQRWRDEIGADVSSWLRFGILSASGNLDIRAPALPVDGYAGNPSRMDETQLVSYLEKQGVRYV